MKQSNPRSKTRWILFGLMLFQYLLLIFSAVRHSPTWDEVGHLGAGLSHWKLGDFSQYCVNPPLVRTMATAPIALALNPVLEWSDLSKDTRQRTEVSVGRRFIKNNSEDFLLYFALARIMCGPFVILGTYVCFAWSKQLFGELAGLLSAGTWVVSPMVLGHGSLITADVAAASLGVCAFYTFRGWLRDSTWSRALLMSTFFALALLAKSTWMIGLAIVPIVWLSWRIVELRKNRMTKLRWGADFRQLVTSGGCVLLLLNAFYGFEGSFRNLGNYDFVSTPLAGRPIEDRTIDSDNRFRSTWLENIPVPLPSSFVHGIDIQSHDFERSTRVYQRPSYLFGQWQVGGWWYYYVVGYAIKEPLPWLILLLLSVPLVGFRMLPGCPVHEGVALLFPAAVVLVFVSSQDELSRHLRYALPVLPFLFTDS